MSLTHANAHRADRAGLGDAIWPGESDFQSVSLEFLLQDNSIDFRHALEPWRRGRNSQSLWAHTAWLPRALVWRTDVNYLGLSVETAPSTAAAGQLSVRGRHALWHGEADLSSGAALPVLHRLSPGMCLT